MTIRIFTPDARLIGRTLADDPGAFEALVLRYQSKAYAIVRALGVRDTGADDVVQEAFLKAFENLPRLRSHDAFESWFLRIVRNAARDSQRAKRVVSTERSLDSVPESACPPASSLEQGELSDRVWRIVSELPEAVREAIFLYYHAGESVRGVARTLGVSRSAALKRMQRGRELLRERLWRELEDSLREMIPSAREWRRRGHRLSLVLLGSVTGSWAGASAASSPTGSAASSASGSANASMIQKTVTGGIGMGGKKTAVLIGIGICLLLTCGYLLRERLSTTSDGGTREAARVVNVEPEGETAARVNASVAEDTADETAAAEVIPASPRPSVAGTVRDPVGRPIAGARLVALDTAAWRRPFLETGQALWDSRGTKRDRTGALRDLHAEYRKLGEAFATTESSEDGTFAFAELAAGEYRILAGHPDHVPALDAAVVVESGTTTSRPEGFPGISSSRRTLLSRERRRPRPREARSAAFRSISSGRPTSAPGSPIVPTPIRRSTSPLRAESSSSMGCREDRTASVSTLPATRSMRSTSRSGRGKRPASGSSSSVAAGS